MASTSDNVSGVSHSLNAFTQINSTMEECSDKSNVNFAVTVSSCVNFKENFDRKLVEYDQQHQGSHRKAWTSDRILEVTNQIKKAQVTMSSGQRRSAMDYYWMSKYDIMRTANEDYLIFKRLTPTAATVRILPREQYYDVLTDIHKSCGHGGRDKILSDLKNRYYIPKKAVEIFVSLCPICETKRNAPRKGIVTKPIVSLDFNLRGQVDLMDFRSCPDGEFKWLLNYQDNATKFLNLRPLKTKRAVEVASELMKIFLIFGAPYILQSDNGREFTANVIKELVAMWPECKIVHGNPHRPQNQVSVERSNQDVENMLRAWMNENKSTNWSVGCFFVQYFKNSSFHQIIARSPYKALFGSEPKAGLYGSDIPTSILLTIETEEQLKTFAERDPAEATSSNYDNNDNNSKTITVKIENLETNLTCAVCHKETTGVHKCESCNSVVQAIKTFVKQEPAETTSSNYDNNDNNSKTITVKIENLGSNFTCVVCHKETTGAHECESCNSVGKAMKTFVKQEPVEATSSDYDNNDNNSKTMVEKIEILESNFTCAVCHKEVTGAHKCESCNSVVQAICGITVGEEGYGSKVVCVKVEPDINLEWDSEHKGLKRAADKMIDTTVKKMPKLDIGNSVLVSVPKADRGPLDMKNIQGKIVDIRNGVHKVGTKYGTIKNWFSRQELQYSDTNYGDEILETLISLSEAVASQSPFGGQEFHKCSCKPAVNQCRNNRCACFKNKVLCGSKCHGSLSCVNK